MKNLLTALAVLCGALLLYGCSPQTPALTESPSKPAETQESMTSATETQTDPYDYGITVTVDSATCTGVAFTLTRNVSTWNESVNFYDFRIDYWDGSQWHLGIQYPYSGVNLPGWKDHYNPGESGTVTREWAEIGALPAGRYRIAALCDGKLPVSERTTREYYGEFEITETTDPVGLKLFAGFFGNSMEPVAYLHPGATCSDVFMDETFWIERQEGNDWVLVNPHTPMALSETKVQLPVNDIQTHRKWGGYDLSKNYAPFPAGTYRLCKRFYLASGEELVRCNTFGVEVNGDKVTFTDITE